MLDGCCPWSGDRHSFSVVVTAEISAGVAAFQSSGGCSRYLAGGNSAECKAARTCAECKGVLILTVFSIGGWST